MNIVIVYESAWGNTRQIAEAIAEGMGQLLPEVVAVEDAPPLQDLQADLLVVGAPTHAFGLSREATRADAHQRGGELLTTGVRDWIDACTSANLNFATFDTHVRRPNLPGHASHSAAKKLKKHGCREVAQAETFYVDGYEGPILPGELDRAREWGIALARGFDSEVPVA